MNFAVADHPKGGYLNVSKKCVPSWPSRSSVPAPRAAGGSTAPEPRHASRGLNC